MMSQSANTFALFPFQAHLICAKIPQAKPYELGLPSL